MSRSLFKSPFIKNKKLKTNKSINNNFIILPSHINKTFFLYNGHQNVKLKVKDEMIGHKFGEFIRTRKICKHKKKK